MRFASRVDTEVQTLSPLIAPKARRVVASAFQDSPWTCEGNVASRREKGNCTSIHMLFPHLAAAGLSSALTPAVIELRNFVMEENGPGGILANRRDRDAAESHAVPLNPCSGQ